MSKSFRLFTQTRFTLKPKYFTLIVSAPIIDKTMNNKSNENNNENEIKSESILDKPLQNIGTPITFGLIMGGCAGYASKKVTKIAAGFIGVTFIGLQILQHNGYITVDWSKVERDVITKMDQNNDGKFDEQDVKILANKYKKILSQSLLSGSGFVSGFYFGLKYG